MQIGTQRKAPCYTRRQLRKHADEGTHVKTDRVTKGVLAL